MTVFSMVPEHVDIELYAGDDFRARLDLRTPAGNTLDASGTYLAQIRPAGWTDVITSFTVNTAGATDGALFLSLTADQTRTLADFAFAPYFSYDLEWTTTEGIITTVIAGTITIKQDISRSSI